MRKFLVLGIVCFGAMACPSLAETDDQAARPQDLSGRAADSKKQPTASFDNRRANKPRMITVVRTWRDLLGQRPFDLGDGITLRVGLEATECPLWSGVLLYAYTEGYDDYQYRETNRDALGPAWVSISFNGHSHDAKKKYDCIPRYQTDLDRSKRLLFARLIIVDKPGDYQISVRTAGTGELARAIVTGKVDGGATFHPWSPLLMLSDARHGELIRGESYKFRRLTPATATYLGKGIALPNIRSDSAILAVVKAKSARDKTRWSDNATQFVLDQSSRALPTLLPTRIDDGMTVSIDAKTLMLRVVPKEKIVTARADWYFLARWWVNGKPFFPEHVVPIPKMDGGQLVMCDDDILIELKLPAAFLKAQRGDQVKLQLMYCPGGWVTVANPQTIEIGGECRFPILTNTVTFAIP